MIRNFLVLAGMLAAIALGTSAGAKQKLGYGALANMYYESRGIEQTYTTPTGRVTMTRERINMLNCAHCDRVEYYEGAAYNVVNNGKEPLCIALNFKTQARSGLSEWGNGEVYLVKGRKAFPKMAGYYRDFGTRGTVEGGATVVISEWAPRADKTCGPIPVQPTL